MHGVQNFLHTHAEQVGGAVAGAATGFTMFETIPNVNTWSIIFKVVGVICFSGVGAATGFFVKRFLERKYPK